MSFTAPSTQLQTITIIISTRTFKKKGGLCNFTEAPSPHGNENYDDNVLHASLYKNEDKKRVESLKKVSSLKNPQKKQEKTHTHTQKPASERSGFTTIDVI